MKNLEISTLDGVDYLFATIVKSGVSTSILLAHVLPLLIEDLSFPKKMRWGNLSVTYPRPIRWIAALFGREVIHFTFGDIQSDKFSFGHAQLDPKKFPLKSPQDYCKQLKEHYVLADPEERKQTILKQLQKLEKS